MKIKARFALVQEKNCQYYRNMKKYICFNHILNIVNHRTDGQLENLIKINFLSIC